MSTEPGRNNGPGLRGTAADLDIVTLLRAVLYIAGGVLIAIGLNEARRRQD